MYKGLKKSTALDDIQITETINTDERNDTSSHTGNRQQFFTVIEIVGQPDSTYIQIPDGQWSCSLQTISIVNFKLENLSQIPAQDNKKVK